MNSLTVVSGDPSRVRVSFNLAKNQKIFFDQREVDTF